MSQLTNLGENLLADFIRGQGISLASSFQLGLLTAVSDSSYTEAAWTGYARQTVARSLLAWSGTQFAGSTLASTGTSHQTSNNAAIDFGTVGAGGSATVTHVGLFTDGELFAYANTPDDSPLVVSDGDPVSLAAGSVVWTLGLTGGLSDYFSNKLIDLVWRMQSFVMPASMHQCLLTSAPTNAGGGTEVSGGGYLRLAIPSTMASWSGTQGPGSTTASTGTGGSISNNNALIYPARTADWGTVVAQAMRDASTGGNFLFWSSLDVPKTANAGGTPLRFEPGTQLINFA